MSGNSRPPSTSGTLASNPCASTPRPTLTPAAPAALVSGRRPSGSRSLHRAHGRPPGRDRDRRVRAQGASEASVMAVPRARASRRSSGLGYRLVCGLWSPALRPRGRASREPATAFQSHGISRPYMRTRSMGHESKRPLEAAAAMSQYRRHASSTPTSSMRVGSPSIPASPMKWIEPRT